jgi:hypothetical protein
MNGRYWMARGWMDHPVFRGERYTRAQAWLWLIENATWKPHKVLVDGKIITLKRGQLSFSIRYLATAWDWRKSRVDRFLKNLVAETMVDTRCSKTGTASGTAQNVITICNYDKYQRRSSTSGTGIGTMLGQQRDSSGTNKKKGKKGNKERGCMDGKPDDAFEEFWDAYPSRFPASNPRKPALEKFRLKVENGTPVEDILRGVEGFAATVAQRRAQEGDAFNPVTAICQAVTFINQERWEQYTAEAETELTDEERAVLARHSGDGQGGTVLDVVSLHASKPGER